jgi:hypothetical protein
VRRAAMPPRAQSPQERAGTALAVRRYPPSGQGPKTLLAPSYGLPGGILALGGLISPADFACVGALTRAKRSGIRQRAWRIGSAGLRRCKNLGRSTGTRRYSTVTRSCTAQPFDIVDENPGGTAVRAILPFSWNRLYARVRPYRCTGTPKRKCIQTLRAVHVTVHQRYTVPPSRRGGIEQKQGVGYAARRAG